MATVSFSNIPVLSTLLTLLQTQLGLFGTDTSAPASASASASAPSIAPLKAVKKRKSRKLALVAGMHVSPAGKKDLLADSHVNFSLRRPPAQLKIVRQFEPDISPLCAGRMTISGSMADVCAELDRMVERETVSCHK